MNDIVLAFIPMFFAMDAIGILPIFATLTQGMERAARRRILVQSMLTAVLVAIGFMFLGKAIFHFLGVTIADFMVAGGLILFCLSIIDLTGHNKSNVTNLEDVGAVPIGTPLIVGPAVLTMILMLTAQYGVLPTLASVLLNLTIVGIVLVFTDFFISLIGRSGSRALSKVMSLLLATIGVMMVRRGLIEIITTVKL